MILGCPDRPVYRGDQQAEHGRQELRQVSIRGGAGSGRGSGCQENRVTRHQVHNFRVCLNLPSEGKTSHFLACGGVSDLRAQALGGQPDLRGPEAGVAC